MPPFRTGLLLFSVLLVGTGDGGGVGWNGGVRLGWVPEIGHDVWGDAPEPSPLSDGAMPAFISERGGTAPPGKRTYHLTPTILITHNTIYITIYKQFSNINVLRN